MGLLIPLLVLASACDPLGAATESAVRTVPGVLYVSSQTGNNDADGLTRDAAFRTVARALENVRPGDTVLILPGVYEEALTLEGLGDASAPITIRGEGGVPVLDGQRISALGIWCEDCSNLILEHLEIRNYTDVGIGVSASIDIVMRDLVVHDNGFQVQLVDWELEGYGVHVEESENVLVENNDVYRNGPNPRPWGELGTGINTYACTDCVIRNNHCHDNVGGILVEDGVGVLVESNTVEDNYLDASEDGWWDGGVWLDGGHDVIVRNNVFRSNLGPGIQISDEDHQKPYGYVLEGNVSTDNTFGIYIWNFGTEGFPAAGVVRMSDNQISGNIEQDVWIESWNCPPPEPCD